jgi:hypothetical protein
VLGDTLGCPEGTDEDGWALGWLVGCVDGFVGNDEGCALG